MQPPRPNDQSDGPTHNLPLVHTVHRCSNLFNLLKLSLQSSPTSPHNGHLSLLAHNNHQPSRNNLHNAIPLPPSFQNSTPRLPRLPQHPNPPLPNNQLRNAILLMEKQTLHPRRTTPRQITDGPRRLVQRRRMGSRRQHTLFHRPRNPPSNMFPLNMHVAQTQK
jgi:hypothetical protein